MDLWEYGLDIINWLVPFILFLDYRKKLKDTRHRFSRVYDVYMGLLTCAFIVFLCVNVVMYDSLEGSNMYHMLSTFYSLFTVVFLVMLVVKMFNYRAILHEKYNSK